MSKRRLYDFLVPDQDASQKALGQAEQITESGPVEGEDALESEELKRQLREAWREEKEREPR